MPKKINQPKQTKELATSSQDDVRIVINQMQEEGVSGLKQQSGFVYEAYNQALFYPQCIPLFHRLRTSMPTMVMVGRTYGAWSTRIVPIIDPPENPTDDDKRYQEFRYQDYENMEGGFSRYIETAVTRVLFDGFGIWDKVLALRDPNWVPPPYKDADGKSWADDWRSEYDDGLIGLRRLAWRDSSTFNGWEFDGAGRATKFKQQMQGKPNIVLDLSECLHNTSGNPNNPEGYAALIPQWRLERLKFGFEQIMGIGFEHAAGHLKFKKVEKGTLTPADLTVMRNAARAVLTAQEGNFLELPFGVEGDVIDVNFAAAMSLLETVKYYDILSLSIFFMQGIALNTLTNTGALASQVDSSNMGVLTFNAAIDGLAAQWNDQVEKEIYRINVEQMGAFPNITKRPKVRFSHIENNVDLGVLGSFIGQIKDIVPLGQDDIIAFRKRAGWMPENPPKPEDVLNSDGTTGKKTTPAPMPMQPQDNMPPLTDQQVADAVNTRSAINQALFVNSRAKRL